MKKIFIALIVGGFTVGIVYATVGSYGFLYSPLASLFYSERTSPESLKKKYEGNYIKILIVPGHTNASPGAVYGSIRESEINVALAYHLADFLSQNPHIRYSILREKDGSYNNFFSLYLKKHRTDIEHFRDRSRGLMKYAVKTKEITRTYSPVHHNTAADNTALELYGINKYANDAGMDVVLHIHFNDYPRKRQYLPGKYSGFSIYVPDAQFPNARVSKEIAESIKNALGYSFAKSDYEKEKNTILEVQELIAVGSNASRDGASLLIEYGYIYEPKLHNNGVRDYLLKEMAYQTYRGIVGYFEPKDAQEKKTTLLPYYWDKDAADGIRGIHILALQAALLEEGLYPPSGKTLNECPLSGYYGGCTSQSVSAFQKAYAITTNSPDIFGPATRNQLNALYDSTPESH